MLRIQQLKMKIPHTEQELREKILRTLRIRPDDLLRYEIVRQSLDARGDELKYVYIIDAEVKKEAAILRKHPKQVGKAQHIRYQFPKSGTERLAHRTGRGIPRPDGGDILETGVAGSSVKCPVW